MYFYNSILQSIGRNAIKAVRDIGKYFLFNYQVVISLPKFLKRHSLIAYQMKKVGIDSLPLVLVTSAFTGMVTAVQSVYQTKGFLPHKYIGFLVGKSVMMELAPVLTALVVAGRVGASMAAELGTMRVTEQIDALHTLAIDPVDYLLLPRIIAGFIMLPVLTVFSILIGMFSGYLIANINYGLSSAMFINGLRQFFLPLDLWGGMSKSFVFGLIISTIGCFEGYYASGGAEGVGKVTTRAVVFSSIFILVMDYVMASILFR